MAFSDIRTYSALVYALPERYPTIRHSTLALATIGPTLAKLEGRVTFANEIVLDVWELVDFDIGCILNYSYEIYRAGEKICWYDPFEHPHIPELRHAQDMLFLKRRVAHRQHFVHHQNLRLQMRRHRKRQPLTRDHAICASSRVVRDRVSIHPARITFRGRINKFFHLRERHDFIETAFDVYLFHPQNRAVQKNIFAPR